MTEVDFPEIHKPRKRKEQLVSKKRWMEMIREMLEINPKTDAVEAFNRIKQIDQTVNPHVDEQMRERYRKVNILRTEQLKQNGIENPDQWAFYTSTQPKDFKSGNLTQPFTEDDMRYWASKLPQGLELAVIQGNISPGSEHDNSENPFQIIDHFWSIYVRVKPQTIAVTPPAIEPPTKPAS